MISTVEKPQQFLSFSVSLDQTQVMVSTQELTEIISLSLSQIVPIPDIPPEVMGICNWRGEMLWLVDIAYLLGKKPLFQQESHLASHSHCSVVVVHAQGLTLGLVVNQVQKLHRYDASQLLLVPSEQAISTLPPCVKSYWLTADGETHWILDCTKLVTFFHPNPE
jgi:positive phototaxis protein PixI